MIIEFKSLTEISKREIIELHNHPLVKKHMPLSKKTFDENDYLNFIEAKSKLWNEHGYGPWAFIVNDQFVGWGGLQYEQGDADLALVLHPRNWGLGKALFYEIIKRAFSEMGFKSITALLPPSRTRVKALFKLGFKEEGEVKIDGENFIKYRLNHEKSY